MFFPFADTGIPIIIVASGISLSFIAAVPTRYIMRLSAFKRLAIFTAEPKAVPRSKALKMHVGPIKSIPSLFSASSNPLQLL